MLIIFETIPKGKTKKIHCRSECKGLLECSLYDTIIEHIATCNKPITMGKTLGYIKEF